MGLSKRMLISCSDESDKVKTELIKMAIPGKTVKIILRADGNSKTGLGHLYRVFALVEMFKHDFDCVLLTNNSTTGGVIPRDYAHVVLPAGLPVKDEPAWIFEHFGAASTWVVMDGYHFGSAYQKAVKNFGYKLACIDDLCQEEMFADVVINHSLSVKASDYKAQTYTKFALGTAYAILRPLFLKAAAQPKTNLQTNQVVICFGGTDPLNLSLKAAEGLLNVQEIKKINIVVGAAYQHTGIYELAGKNAKIAIHKDLSEQQLIELMSECDLAIAPASNILYEICAVKMPVLSGYYVENQLNIYKGALEKKIIIDGGNFGNYGPKDFEHQISKLLEENNLNQYIEAQSGLFDKNIRNRFLALINSVTYRKATGDDLLLVYNWANDKVSRANSYFSEPISLPTHTAWYQRKMADNDCFIYIAMINDIPAAMVRYEKAEDKTVVGILVDEAFRGKGWAGIFLKDTAALYFETNHQPVLAYIKKTNLASVKSFVKAGYHLHAEEIVQGHESFVYQLVNRQVPAQQNEATKQKIKN